MQAEPQDQHRWLEQLVGEWTYESECFMGPDQPPSLFKGVEVIRSLGGLWILGESEGAMPGEGIMKSIITLGYDPTADRFVGTFIASVMTHLWVYSGSLDPEGRVLTLEAEGPDFTAQKMAKYQDAIEIVSDDHHILSSQTLQEDGTWLRFMTAHYRRKPSPV